MFWAGCSAPAAPAEEPAAEATEAPAEEAAAEEPAEEAAGDNVTIYGETLPDDALPYDEQVYRIACDITANHTTFDFHGVGLPALLVVATSSRINWSTWTRISM